MKTVFTILGGISLALSIAFVFFTILTWSTLPQASSEVGPLLNTAIPGGSLSLFAIAAFNGARAFDS